MAEGELVFDVDRDEDGGYFAVCRTETIITQGDTWEELRANVKEATEGFFFDATGPQRIRLHVVRDEVFSL